MWEQSTGGSQSKNIETVSEQYSVATMKLEKSKKKRRKKEEKKKKAGLLLSDNMCNLSIWI